MTKVEALHEVITALGGTPTGTTVSECIAEITTIEGGAPTAGASTSEAIHELAVALTPEPPEPTVTYTLTFDIGTASGTTPDPIEVTAGESVTLPDDSGFEYEGFTFNGWYTSEGDAEHPVSNPFTPSGDETLYAAFIVV